MHREQKIDQLVEDLCHAGLSGKYGEQIHDNRWVKIWVRDAFHCVYCNANLLADVIRLSSAQIDHLLPKTKYREFEDFDDNLVLSCFCCNQIKRTFDPLKKCNDVKITLDNFGEHRERLIDESREFINKKLRGKEKIRQESLSAILRWYRSRSKIE